MPNIFQVSPKVVHPGLHRATERDDCAAITWGYRKAGPQPAWCIASSAALVRSLRLRSDATLSSVPGTKSLRNSRSQTANTSSRTTGYQTAAEIPHTRDATSNVKRSIPRTCAALRELVLSSRHHLKTVTARQCAVTGALQPEVRSMERGQTAGIPET
jgi:hypothetical protein